MLSKKLIGASYEPLVLSILGNGSAYGYQIIQRVHELSDGKIRWTAGTLYPLLHQLEARGLVQATWETADTGRERKYYALTDKGLRSLAGHRSEWLDLHRILEDLWTSTPGLAPA